MAFFPGHPVSKKVLFQIEKHLVTTKYISVKELTLWIIVILKIIFGNTIKNEWFITTSVRVFNVLSNFPNLVLKPISKLLQKKYQIPYKGLTEAFLNVLRWLIKPCLILDKLMVSCFTPVLLLFRGVRMDNCLTWLIFQRRYNFGLCLWICKGARKIWRSY